MASFAADPAEVIIQQAETDEGHWVPLGSYKVTFYCNCKRCCGKWAGGPTASETMPVQGRTVACGSLPLGTHILIEGMGERVVEDRGVKGRHIDVYMDSHSECLKNGVKHLQVFRWVQD
jgi:3D (Asp-Asp-Asp) domain-containing protein